MVTAIKDTLTGVKVEEYELIKNGQCLTDGCDGQERLSNRSQINLFSNIFV